MARKRIGMKKIRDVIRLKSTTELSERQIARALSISRPIVAKYWNGFLFSGLAYEQIAEMADSELLRLVERPRESKSARYREMAQYFSHIVVELKRKGVTLQLLWEEYKEKHSDGYQYSQFCYHFNNWKNASEVRMHIKHKAGDKMFVDYAGEKWPITDTRTGKKRLVEVFVAVLGASGLSYVEATASQQEQDWIRSNERALWYRATAMSRGSTQRSTTLPNTTTPSSFPRGYERPGTKLLWRMPCCWHTSASMPP
jgi:hypothetical protein